jgi:hypothetical protein
VERQRACSSSDWRYNRLLLHLSCRPGIRRYQRTVDLPATPLVPGLLTVGHDLRCQPEVLLGFDDRRCMTEALILDYGRVADTLVFVEDAVGKGVALPTNFYRPVRKVVDFDVPT